MKSLIENLRVLDGTRVDPRYQERKRKRKLYEEKMRKFDETIKKIKNPTHKKGHKLKNSDKDNNRVDQSEDTDMVDASDVNLLNKPTNKSLYSQSRRLLKPYAKSMKLQTKKNNFKREYRRKQVKTNDELDKGDERVLSFTQL